MATRGQSAARGHSTDPADTRALGRAEERAGGFAASFQRRGVFYRGTRRSRSELEQAAPAPRGTRRGCAPPRSASARYRAIPAVTFRAVIGEGRTDLLARKSRRCSVLARSGSRPDAVYGRSPDDRVLGRELARGCQNGGPFFAECRFLAADGRVVWVHGEGGFTDESAAALWQAGLRITEHKRRTSPLERAIHAAREEGSWTAQGCRPRPRASSGARADSRRNDPASKIGGDYYDVLPVEGGMRIDIGEVWARPRRRLVNDQLQSSLSTTVLARPRRNPATSCAMVNSALVHKHPRRLARASRDLSLLRTPSMGKIVFSGAHEEMISCAAAAEPSNHRHPALARRAPRTSESSFGLERY